MNQTRKGLTVASGILMLAHCVVYLAVSVFIPEILAMFVIGLIGGILLLVETLRPDIKGVGAIMPLAVVFTVVGSMGVGVPAILLYISFAFRDEKSQGDDESCNQNTCQCDENQTCQCKEDEGVCQCGEEKALEEENNVSFEEKTLEEENAPEQVEEAEQSEEAEQAKETEQSEEAEQVEQVEETEQAKEVEQAEEEQCECENCEHSDECDECQLEDEEPSFDHFGVEIDMKLLEHKIEILRNMRDNGEISAEDFKNMVADLMRN